MPDVVYTHPKTGAKFYIGDEISARTMEILEQCGIYHIINAKGDQGECYFENDSRFSYLRFHVNNTQKDSNDHSKGVDTHEGVIEFFKPPHDFIDQNLEKGNNVMVHCLAGAHRAGATGVSYLMKAGQMKYMQARKIAKSRRPVVDPYANLEELL